MKFPAEIQYLFAFRFAISDLRWNKYEVTAWFRQYLADRGVEAAAGCFIRRPEL